jgi:hypothetical protein
MKYLLIIAIAIFGLATVTFGQTIPSYVPTDGLIGWWPFNGNAIDESDFNNDGTVNGATLTADRFGNANTAYSFDGENDMVDLGNSSLFEFGQNNFTISFWFKTDLNQFAPLICKRNDSPSFDQYSIFLGTITPPLSTNPSMEINCFFKPSPGDPTVNDRIILSPELNMSWHNVQVVHSFSDSTSLFIDGVFVGMSNTQYLTENFNILGANLILGFTNVLGQNFYFNGELDDIGIWNRTLNQEEISNVYNVTNCSNNLTISTAANQLEIGSTVNFIATTSDPNPSYVWQSDFGQGFQTLNDYGNYSGVNTNSLSISNVQLSEHNQPIRVISTSGECIDTSDVSTINITDTCIVTINDTITTLISVTDTLVINTLITGLTPPNNSNTIKVFPNPANSHITIDFGNFESMNGYTLTITNSIGQTVYTTPINEQSSYIDLSTWSGNGIYFVQIIDAQNNTIENRKIVLQ